MVFFKIEFSTASTDCLRRHINLVEDADEVSPHPSAAALTVARLTLVSPT